MDFDICFARCVFPVGLILAIVFMIFIIGFAIGGCVTRKPDNALQK